MTCYHIAKLLKATYNVSLRLALDPLAPRKKSASNFASVPLNCSDTNVLRRPVNTSAMSSALPMQPLSVSNAATAAANSNYNISQLMNPIDISGAKPSQGKKGIDIDAFAGLK